MQGGLDTSPGGLREVNLRGMVARNLPGYAIGGLAGGEAKEPFWRVVHQCCRALPPGKPRYLMGVGYPLDLVVCVALGVDMYAPPSSGEARSARRQRRPRGCCLPLCRCAVSFISSAHLMGHP